MAVSLPSGARSTVLQIGAITDLAVGAFGVWTVVVHAVVIAGGTIAALAAATAATFAVLAALFVLAVRRGSFARDYVPDLFDDPISAPPAVGLRGAAALSAIAILTLVAWLATRDAWAAWGGVAAFAVVAATLAWVEPFASAAAGGVAADEGAAVRRTLHTIALVCAAFTLLAYRPRSDDTLYLHLAVSALDYPNQALLAVQTLHGPASATLAPQTMFPPYRVHTFELLGALLSYATGIDPARAIHMGLATVFAWLTPFALARLFRLLAPRAWLLAVFVAVSFYFIEGSASRGYANHALVRMFNGKSVLLTAWTPLICAYGLRFAARPTTWRFALLALAQISAIGLSSTGLWLAPTLAIISVVAGAPGLRATLRHVPWALLTSAYVLAIGFWVMAQMKGAVEPAEFDATTDAAEALSASASTPRQFAATAEAIAIALGPERTAIALVAVALLSIPLAPGAAALRLFAGLSFVAAIFFGNPLLSGAVARWITGALTYYRFFWLVPIPIMLGASATTLYAALRKRMRPAGAWPLTALALLAFYAVATDRLVISEANQAKLVFPPALKLWAHARAVAEEVCRQAPLGKLVLASRAVMHQLPIIRGCGHPLIADPRWMSGPEQDEQRRLRLAEYVGHAGDLPLDQATWFLDSLAHYRPDAVVISKAAQPNGVVKSLVRSADYEKAATVEYEQIYVRTRPTTREKYRRVAAEVCRLTRGGPGATVLAPFGVSDALDDREGDCTETIAAPGPLRTAARDELDTALRLERFTYMESDAKPAEDNWILVELSRRRTEIIVLNRPALGNTRFKSLLRRLGFRSVKSVDGHTIVRRPLPT